MSRDLLVTSFCSPSVQWGALSKVTSHSLVCRSVRREWQYVFLPRTLITFCNWKCIFKAPIFSQDLRDHVLYRNTWHACRLIQYLKNTNLFWGPWVAQSVKHMTVGLGHDLIVLGIKPLVGLRANSTEPAWDSLSPSLSAPPLLALSFSPFLSLKINKLKNNNNNHHLFLGLFDKYGLDLNQKLLSTGLTLLGYMVQIWK